MTARLKQESIATRAMDHPLRMPSMALRPAIGMGRTQKRRQSREGLRCFLPLHELFEDRNVGRANGWIRSSAPTVSFDLPPEVQRLVVHASRANVGLAT